MEETTPHATTTEPVPAATPTSPVGDPHAWEHAYLYVDSGIAEGHGRVPRWLLGVVLLLFGFFGWYVMTQWNAQPNTAQARAK